MQMSCISNPERFNKVINVFKMSKPTPSSEKFLSTVTKLLN